MLKHENKNKIIIKNDKKKKTNSSQSKLAWYNYNSSCEVELSSLKNNKNKI